jgi:hypothetical protein
VTPYQYEVNIFGGVGVASLVFFLSSLWKEKDPAALQSHHAFAADLATPAVDEHLRWSGNALSSYRIVGVLTIAIGLVVIALGFVPASMAVHAITLVCGAGTAFMGWLMMWYFRRQTRLLSKQETGEEGGTDATHH